MEKLDESLFNDSPLNTNDMFLLRDCLRSLGMSEEAKSIYGNFSGENIQIYINMVERRAIDQSRKDILDDLFMNRLIYG